MVSGDPDIQSFEYETGDILVLACDGLWDHVSYEEVAKLLSDESGIALSPAQRLVRAAKENESNDNISVIVIRLTNPNSCGKVKTATTDPDAAAEMEASGKKEGDESSGGDKGPSTDPDTESDKSTGSPGGGGGQEKVVSAADNNHMSMKRVADTELEVSDDEKVGVASAGDEELGTFFDSGSSVDVQHSSSQGSQQNYFHLSKAGSIEDALMAVAAEFTSEFSPSSSGPSDVVRTTSEDTSGQSPDPSVEASAVEMHVANMHKRTKRRSMASWQRRQKENRRPSDGGDEPDETPPCLRAGSPLLCEEDGGRPGSSLSESCCRSLSLPSGSGALLNAHHSGGIQRVATGMRPGSESKSRISSFNAPSRWTIAVEVDADVGMFEEENPGIIAGAPNSAVNLSSHW